ncbi:MAG: 5-(carboxyamino)imidazole ribonucleotide synthase [Planctomycetaceae bacterium]|nr:5-(carboxyamino)imidazole ribonucleotide synthase [Planctomycetaceae bacterium]
MPVSASPILPGSTLGILGGGQLGAMFAVAAKRMGYRVEAISDVADCPAARVCDRVHVGGYADAAFLARAAATLDVVTFEFENVPAAAGRALAAVVPVRPHPDVLFTTQDRAREKAFLVTHGFACAAHRIVRSRDDLQAAMRDLGLPAVLKTAAFGYDGKGQAKLATAADLDPAWATLSAGPDGPRELVLESWIDFDCEISVVAARGLDGAVAAFAPARNAHAHHILDVSSVPAGLPDDVLAAATGTTERILTALGVVGVACVEFFVTKDGRVLVNEIAPRTHNSGHLTIEACETSQFEQQVRAVCGLPLGSTRQVAPAAMANLLGDCWFTDGTAAGREPDWAAALAVPGVRLHLYGKTEPRPGRKMGHLTAVAASAEEARSRVTTARHAACRG